MSLDPLPAEFCPGASGAGGRGQTDAPDLDLEKENQPYSHQSTGMIFKDVGPDLAAGTLIEQAGLKGAASAGAEGLPTGPAPTPSSHSGAKAADVLRLIDQMRQRVWQQFGYDLETQLQVW